MKTCYFKRIEDRERTRIKVMTEASIAWLTIITYSLTGNSLFTASWTRENRQFDLTNREEEQAYVSFLTGFEECPRKEFQYALQEIQKKHHREVKSNTEEAPIPVSELRKRINAFLGGKKTSQI
jgi:hypothetical protein